LICYLLFFARCRDHRALHSFPTRRSSDLDARLHIQSLPWHSKGLNYESSLPSVNESSAAAGTSSEHVQADHAFPAPSTMPQDGSSPRYVAFQSLWWSADRPHPEECLCLPDRPDTLRSCPKSAYAHIGDNPDRHVSVFYHPVQNPVA